MVTLTDEQARKIVRLVCEGQHLSNRARQAMDAGNSHASLAYYYRLDSEVLPRLVKQLPDELQAAIAEGSANETPPGK